MIDRQYKIRFRPERFGGYRAEIWSRGRFFWRYEFWFQLTGDEDHETEAREKAMRLIPTHLRGQLVAKKLKHGLTLP